MVASKYDAVKAFIQRSDWFVSAGVTLAIYVLLFLTLYVTGGLGDWLAHVIHLLLPVAGIMAWLGLKDKQRKEAEEGERMKKRKSAQALLTKLQKETPGPGGPAGAEKERGKS